MKVREGRIERQGSLPLRVQSPEIDPTAEVDQSETMSGSDGLDQLPPRPLLLIHAVSTHRLSLRFPARAWTSATWEREARSDDSPYTLWRATGLLPHFNGIKTVESRHKHGESDGKRSSALFFCPPRRIRHPSRCPVDISIPPTPRHG